MIRSLAFVVVTAGIATVVAQNPGTAPAPTATPAPDVTLVSLQALVTDGVYVRDPLQSEPDASQPVASTALRPFAAIHDARFTTEGHLLELVVRIETSPQQIELRRLPVADVTWSEATQRWLVRNNLQFAELAKVEPTAPGNSPRPDDKVAKQPTWLARDLLTVAPVAVQSSTPAPEPPDAPSKKEQEPAAPPAAPAEQATRATIWFAPKAGRLAFASFPVGERIVLVPWAMLTLESNSGNPAEPHLRCTADPALLVDAPTCIDAKEQPKAALRRCSYEHFGVACPAWEPSADSGDRRGVGVTKPTSKSPAVAAKR